MHKFRRVVAGGAGALGVLLLGVGIVYLTVACENLPGILGPHPGDASPRTPRGVAGIALGVVALTIALLAARRQPPDSAIQP